MASEELPVEITLREIPNSEAVELKIRNKIDKLKVFFSRMEFCKIVVELYQKHKHQGRLFSVLIEIGVPGKKLVVNHKHDEDLYVVIRDAFKAMKRRLESHIDRQRGIVKAHAESLHGRIVRLFNDYGFIEDDDGQEYYFHASNMMVPNFHMLEEGLLVNFQEVAAGDSLQAAHVSL